MDLGLAELVEVPQELEDVRPQGGDEGRQCSGERRRSRFQWRRPEGGGASREAAATQFESGGGDRREDLGTTPGSPTPVAWIRVTEG